jgi:hypothetical protein
MNESTPISKQVSVLSKPKALILVTIVEVMQALVTLQKPAFAFLASIYSRHYPAKLLYLDDLEVECPYCSTRNSRETVSRSNTFGSSLASVFSYERSSNTESNSFRINCQFCSRKYDIMLISDHTWLKSRISYTDVVLQQMATVFPSEVNPIDMIFANITGIAKLQNGVVHICFRTPSRRFYLNCSRENGQMQAYMLSEVSL